MNAGLEGPVLAEGTFSVGRNEGLPAVGFVGMKGVGVGVELPSDSFRVGGVVDICILISTGLS